MFAYSINLSYLYLFVKSDFLFVTNGYYINIHPDQQYTEQESVTAMRYAF